MPRPLRVIAIVPPFLLLAGCAALSPSRPASTPAAAEAAGMAAGAALRADARAALAELSKAPAEAFQGDDAAFRICMQERFDRDTVPDFVTTIADPLARDALRAYQRYWWRALRDPDGREAAEKDLIEQLAALIAVPVPPDAKTQAELGEQFRARLRERGYHSLQGRTLPLFDLFLWQKQDELDFDVALPAGEVQRVRVHLMDDFASRGWGHYATCGRRAAGGWAKTEGLYAVRQSYGDLADEDFRVTFLGHEAQHFADMQRWPEMESWLLEFRAKLAELAMADGTAHDVLERFYESEGGDAKRQPHPFANRKVITDLGRRLGTERQPADLRKVDPVALRRAARDLLIEDTRLRTSLADVNSVR